MATRGGTAEVADSWVEVSEVERRQVYDFSFDQFPDTCLKKKCVAITKGGLTVKVERFGQEVELDDVHKRVIRNDWGGMWEREFYRYGQTFGVVVVKPIPHTRAAGEAKMLLVPWNKYKLSFTENSMHERKYYVTYTDASYEDNGGESQAVVAYSARVGATSNRVQPNENNKGYPTWQGGTSSLIFVFYPPTTEGRLTSPIASMRNELLILKRSLENEEMESYWARRPLHAYETVRDVGAPGNRDTMVTFGVGQFTNGDMNNERERYRFQKNLEAHIDLMLASRAAKQQRMVNAQEKHELQTSMYQVGDASRPAGDSVVSQTSPTEHKISVPVNQHLVAGPPVGGYSNFTALWDVLMPIAYSTMGIPRLVMNPGSAEIQGDPALAMREWDEHIQGEQTMLNSFYEEMYSVAFYERARRYINTFYKAWKQETQDIVKRAGKELDASEEPFDAAAEALDKVGKREVVDLLRKDRQKQQRSVMKDLVTENVQVIFSHNHTAFQTFQDLTEAYSVDAIAEDYYVQQVGRRISAPPDQILDEKAREKQRREKLKRKTDELGAQLETQAAYAPPVPAGPDGKGGQKAPKLPKPPQKVLAEDKAPK